MPNCEEHSKYSLERYGKRAGDIHKFLDEPASVYGKNHREFRHDTETIKLVGKLFGQIYGKTEAESIALDHIMLDHLAQIKKGCEVPVEKVRSFEEPVKLDVGSRGGEKDEGVVMMEFKVERDEDGHIVNETACLKGVLQQIEGALAEIRAFKAEVRAR
jgi:hypothetical protein